MPKLTALPAGTTLATAVDAIVTSKDCQNFRPGNATIQFGPNVNRFHIATAASNTTCHVDMEPTASHTDP
ncbi:MAG TPA: hypothetical protein VM282_25685 [Acidimicrobiales bacterium]|nr:hypothetical protein [Acidimicrobiales bacterium]